MAISVEASRCLLLPHARQPIPSHIFAEKPDQPTAQKYVDSGDYYWNAGIFVWHIEVILQEIATHLPALSQELKNISAALHSEREHNVVQEVYARLDSISIDHGVLEKSGHLAVVPADIGWSDLGKWSALYHVLQCSQQDERGNVLSPNVLDRESETSFVYSSSERTIATLGLKDTVVAGYRRCVTHLSPSADA